MTNGELISQIRNQLKDVSADSKLTDKFIYSIMKKHAKWLIKREANKLQIMRFDYLFQTLKCVDVEQAPAIDDCCGIKGKCRISRTVHKVPRLFEDIDGVIIRSVFSIDGSVEYTPITIQEYMRKLENPHSKYDKSIYYYFNNGYLYFPKDYVKKIMIKGYFEDDIRKNNSCVKCEDEDPACISKLDQEFRLPEHLNGELMNFVIQDIANVTMKLQADEDINKNDNRKN
jgi:hypothetical protein